jgi:hypothetical protein
MVLGRGAIQKSRVRNPILSNDDGLCLIFTIFCRPIHGLIFLFKWVREDEPAGAVVQDR